MVEVGLWIRVRTDGNEEVFLIQKDPEGHPTFSTIQSSSPIESQEAKKAKIRQLYEQMVGQTHPHPYATSRQLMWDFLEAALKRLP